MDTLKKCLAAGTSPVQVVRFAADYLREAGFLELPWDLRLSLGVNILSRHFRTCSLPLPGRGEIRPCIP